MILSGPEIVTCVNRTRQFREAGASPPLPRIDITPFDPDRAGPNSYDVTLGDTLLTYALAWSAEHTEWCIDARKENKTTEVRIPESGFVLRPHTLYLGSTVERTECAGVVPWLDGRSSVGRLGMAIHVTAGRGDDGFGEEVPGGCSWTLEIMVAHPLKVYPGMRCGQLSFFTMKGDRNPYRSKYGKQTGPVASRLWQDKENSRDHDQT